MRNRNTMINKMLTTYKGHGHTDRQTDRHARVCARTHTQVKGAEGRNWVARSQTQFAKGIEKENANKAMKREP